MWDRTPRCMVRIWSLALLDISVEELKQTIYKNQLKVVKFKIAQP